MSPWPPSVNTILHGLLGLALSLLVWRLTHSWLGWAVLFAPGAGLVLWGILTGFTHD